jgi:carbon storage regulator
MLILSRRLNESIVIDDQIMVTILKVEGEVVKLGFQAPTSVSIHRQEVYEEIKKRNLEAKASSRALVGGAALKLEAQG